MTDRKYSTENGAPMNLTRTLIIGNSGSGKSWLAERLAEHLQVQWIDLDSIHWLSDEHSIARPRGEALAMARIAASEERWVIEGVYGGIVRELIHRATALIWLCVDDKSCVANIGQRENKPVDDELLIALQDGPAVTETVKTPVDFAHTNNCSKASAVQKSSSWIKPKSRPLRTPRDQPTNLTPRIRMFARSKMVPELMVTNSRKVHGVPILSHNAIRSSWRSLRTAAQQS